MFEEKIVMGIPVHQNNNDTEKDISHVQFELDNIISSISIDIEKILTKKMKMKCPIDEIIILEYKKIPDRNVKGYILKLMIKIKKKSIHHFCHIRISETIKKKYIIERFLENMREKDTLGLLYK